MGQAKAEFPRSVSIKFPTLLRMLTTYQKYFLLDKRFWHWHLVFPRIFSRNGTHILACTSDKFSYLDLSM